MSKQENVWVWDSSARGKWETETTWGLNRARERKKGANVEWVQGVRSVSVCSLSRSIYHLYGGTSDSPDSRAVKWLSPLRNLSNQSPDFYCPLMMLSPQPRRCSPPARQPPGKLAVSQRRRRCHHISLSDPPQSTSSLTSWLSTVTNRPL